MVPLVLTLDAAKFGFKKKKKKKPTMSFKMLTSQNTGVVPILVIDEVNMYAWTVTKSGEGRVVRL